MRTCMLRYECTYRGPVENADAPFRKASSLSDGLFSVPSVRKTHQPMNVRHASLPRQCCGGGLRSHTPVSVGAKRRRSVRGASRPQDNAAPPSCDATATASDADAVKSCDVCTFATWLWRSCVFLGFDHPIEFRLAMSSAVAVYPSHWRRIRDESPDDWMISGRGRVDHKGNKPEGHRPQPPIESNASSPIYDASRTTGAYATLNDPLLRRPIQNCSGISKV
ncbi:hypothetical protein VTO73DRAFT_11352 [Trametes versicolor]